MSTKKTIAAINAPAGVTYRDKSHTSRSLFMPDGRELKVVGGHLMVPEGDNETMAYMDSRRDFERPGQVE
ncbi:hypothetical protein [Pseudomonas sp. NPDC089758]|uniref:hypothetical protein n=1 Tax=Pseudomonas sp. NPDC089758 TaxID=3364473 RepID=UPI00383002A9